MSQDQQQTAIIRADTIIKGRVGNCRLLEVFGYIEGEIAAETLRIHEGGRVFGTVKADFAEVQGLMQGTVAVRQLISIGPKGTVSGNVRYGRLELAAGGDLSADIRNIPPEIAGDLQIAVRQGRSVRVETVDLSANDPDDEAKNLTFTVSNARSGFLALSASPRTAIQAFTQSDLQQGSVLFVHDGSTNPSASFDVVVADQSGATSGAAKTVQVAVIPT